MFSLLITAWLYRLRCNRQQPCSTCSSSGQTCLYPEDNARPMAPVPGMHERLVQLEHLVKSVATRLDAISNQDLGSPSRPAEIPRPDTPIDGQSARGSMRLSASEFHYICGGHWAAILESIADLKDHYNRGEQDRPSNSSGQGQDYTGDAGVANTHASKHSLLLYGGYQHASQAEILAALPQKGAVDRYVSRYFNRHELVSCKCSFLTKL